MSVDYIKAALELLPGPAALYDLSDLSFAEGNDAARRFVLDLLGEQVTREEARAAFGIEEMLGEIGSGTRYHRELNGCWLFGSLIPAQRLARPDLVLLTLHCDVTFDVAQLDHQRMCMVLRVNETAGHAISSLEAMIVQAKGAVVAQRNLVDAYNAQAEELIRRNYAR